MGFPPIKVALVVTILGFPGCHETTGLDIDEPLEQAKREFEEATTPCDYQAIAEELADLVDNLNGDSSSEFPAEFLRLRCHTRAGIGDPRLDWQQIKIKYADLLQADHYELLITDLSDSNIRYGLEVFENAKKRFPEKAGDFQRLADRIIRLQQPTQKEIRRMSVSPDY